MRLLFSSFALALTTAVPPPPAAAQALIDTTLSWQGYARPSRCQVRLYPAPAGDARTRTVVIRELASNEGPTAVDDARYLVELVGRRFGFDPAEAYWVFHWGGFSHAGAAPEAGKELFLRATFRRTGRGTLSAPSWKVISREEAEELADRRLR